MPFAVSSSVVIPERDIQLSFVRASGPGGQNVNQVATAVQLRFDLAGTGALEERIKQRLRGLAGRRLTDDGSILIIARNHRTQERNRAEAFARLAELVRRALVEPRPRRPTRPTRASQTKRLERKARHGRDKQLRSKARWSEG
jgi:ribosome-associated protein